MLRPAFLLLISLATGCLAQSIERIVVAGSALTETVCALGDCEKIVAADKTSVYPAEIQQLPSIGYRSAINAEGIIGLRPGLFIAEKGYVEGAVLNQIKSAGVTTLVIERAYDLDGTRRLINSVGEALHRSAEADALIRRIELQVAEANVLVRKSKLSPRVMCIYNRGTSSIDIAGAKTFSGILSYVGAAPAIDGIEGYKPLNTEALVAANPDYLLMFESGVQSLGGIDGVLKVPGVMQTTAGKKKQIIAMEGIKLSNFGPRVGETIKELTVLLHPDVQPD